MGLDVDTPPVFWITAEEPAFDRAHLTTKKYASNWSKHAAASFVALPTRAFQKPLLDWTAEPYRVRSFESTVSGNRSFRQQQHVSRTGGTPDLALPFEEHQHSSIGAAKNALWI
jgi:hypothetical protein